MIGSEALVVCSTFILSEWRERAIRTDVSLANQVVRTCSLSVDRPYPVYGGIFREEAIMLLRRFYVQQNEKGKLRLL